MQPVTASRKAQSELTEELSELDQIGLQVGDMPLRIRVLLRMQCLRGFGRSVTKTWIPRPRPF